MASRLIRELVILLLVLAVVALAAFGVARLARGGSGADGPPEEIGIEWERSFAEGVRAYIERQYSERILRSGQAVDPVRSIVARLEQAVEPAFGEPLPFPVEFYLVESADDNAFAFPGGIVLVHTGLIRVTGSPEELAAVIAHEMGHVYHRDSMAAIARSVGISVLLAFQTGGAADVVELVLRTVVDSSFSRSQERRADEFAVRLMAAASLPPEALATFFERLDTDEAAEERLHYISTHPLTAGRIDEIRRLSSEYPVSAEPLNLDWVAYKKNLSVLTRR